MAKKQHTKSLFKDQLKAAITESMVDLAKQQDALEAERDTITARLTEIEAELDANRESQKSGITEALAELGIDLTPASAAPAKGKRGPRKPQATDDELLMFIGAQPNGVTFAEVEEWAVKSGYSPYTKNRMPRMAKEGKLTKEAGQKPEGTRGRPPTIFRVA